MSHSSPRWPPTGQQLHPGIQLMLLRVPRTTLATRRRFRASGTCNRGGHARTCAGSEGDAAPGCPTRSAPRLDDWPNRASTLVEVTARPRANAQSPQVPPPNRPAPAAARFRRSSRPGRCRQAGRTRSAPRTRLVHADAPVSDAARRPGLRLPMRPRTGRPNSWTHDRIGASPPIAGRRAFG